MYAIRSYDVYKNDIIPEGKDVQRKVLETPHKKRYKQRFQTNGKESLARAALVLPCHVELGVARLFQLTEYQQRTSWKYGSKGVGHDVITSYSIHYTKLYETITINGADDSSSVAVAAGSDTEVLEHGLLSVGDTSETAVGSFEVSASDGIV